MYCMKCGRETDGRQVFCETCLQTMEQYPIKPGTPVNLPNRTNKKPTPRKRPPSVEEQLSQLKRISHRLIWVAAILAIAFVLTAATLLNFLLQEQGVPAIGKNYTIDTTQAP